LSVFSVVCLSGRGLCDGLITRPEESYRLWCVLVSDLGTSRMRRLKLIKGCKCRIEKNYLLKTNIAQVVLGACIMGVNKRVIRVSVIECSQPDCAERKMRGRKLRSVSRTRALKLKGVKQGLGGWVGGLLFQMCNAGGEKGVRRFGIPISRCVLRILDSSVYCVT
jgi:hypothetical protein